MSQKHLRSGPITPGVAFITGGFRGLGNAVACSFAKEGASGVVLVDINDEETMKEGKAAVEEYGIKCLTIRADVTKESEVERAVAEAVVEFGRIDYAANFAGVVGPVSLTADTTIEGWNQVMSVNSNGVFLCTKHELRQMMKQNPIEGIEEGRIAQRGSIVNSASVNSTMAGAGTVGYTASKHAVAGITKAVGTKLFRAISSAHLVQTCASDNISELTHDTNNKAALEGRGQGIRVNSVSPGFLLTQLLAPALNSGALPRSTWDGCVARQGREAMAEEVGDVVVLLSAPRMSLVNGVNLPIDNGFVVNEMI